MCSLQSKEVHLGSNFCHHGTKWIYRLNCSSVSCYKWGELKALKHGKMNGVFFYQKKSYCTVLQNKKSWYFISFFEQMKLCAWQAFSKRNLWYYILSIDILPEKIHYIFHNVWTKKNTVYFCTSKITCCKAAFPRNNTVLIIYVKSEQIFKLKVDKNVSNFCGKFLAKMPPIDFMRGG